MNTWNQKKKLKREWAVGKWYITLLNTYIWRMEEGKGSRIVRIIKEAIWKSGGMRITEVKMQESFQKGIGMVIEIMRKCWRSISLWRLFWILLSFPQYSPSAPCSDFCHSCYSVYLFKWKEPLQEMKPSLIFLKFCIIWKKKKLGSTPHTANRIISKLLKE